MSFCASTLYRENVPEIDVRKHQNESVLHICKCKLVMVIE